MMVELHVKRVVGILHLFQTIGQHLTHARSLLIRLFQAIEKYNQKVRTPKPSRDALAY